MLSGERALAGRTVPPPSFVPVFKPQHGSASPTAPSLACGTRRVPSADTHSHGQSSGAVLPQREKLFCCCCCLFFFCYFFVVFFFPLLPQQPHPTSSVGSWGWLGSPRARRGHGQDAAPGRGRLVLAPHHLRWVQRPQCQGWTVSGYPVCGDVPPVAASPLPAAGGARFPQSSRYSQAASLPEDTGSIPLLWKSPKRAGIFLDLLLNKSSPLLLTCIKGRKMLGAQGEARAARHSGTGARLCRVRGCRA